MYIFFNDTATTEIYTLSLYDALPICLWHHPDGRCGGHGGRDVRRASRRDRKSTRLNSSHLGISYHVFCLKKKEDAQNLCLGGEAEIADLALAQAAEIG